MKFVLMHSQTATKNSSSIEGVSLTAHFTSAVWAEEKVPGANLFVTRKGKWVRQIVRWGGATLGLFGSYEVANLFLTPRHLGINALLVERDFPQIIELAAGLSSRGQQWATTHSGKYLEIDQPSIVCTKRSILADNSQNKPNHFLIPADLRSTDLVATISSIVDFNQPTLIICEGLTGYFNEAALTALLQKIYGLAAKFDNATVWLDFYLKLDHHQHGRVAWAMLPAQLLWKLLNSPMRMFLRNQTDIARIVAANNFQVRKLWSAPELAQLAGRASPPVTLFYLAEITCKS